MQLTAGRRAAPFSSTTGGSRKPILVAAVLGLLAALLSWNYVQRAGQSTKQAGLVPVVVAAQDIPVRTQVTAGMLQVKQVPADTRHEKAFTGLEQLDAKVTNLPISAGEQVLSTKFFARKEDSGLAFRIGPGKRAVSVQINEVISTGGLINPGDFVDVIAIFPPAPNSADPASDSAGMVLQNIEVLAIAQALGGPAADPTGAQAVAAQATGSRSDGRTEAVARPNARTATLAVTPEEAQKLILAEEKGKIRLALRGVEDHATVGVGSTRTSQLRG
jgi:pilus assembly protein CpaB